MMMLLLDDAFDRSRRADEHTPQALLEKARLNEVLEQCAAHLPVEARHLRSIGGGQSGAGIDEQIPDARECFLDTARLEWLLHLPGLHSRLTTRVVPVFDEG
jgi:hypothetical protein